MRFAALSRLPGAYQVQRPVKLFANQKLGSLWAREVEPKQVTQLRAVDTFKERFRDLFRSASFQLTLQFELWVRLLSTDRIGKRILLPSGQ